MNTLTRRPSVGHERLKAMLCEHVNKLLGAHPEAMTVGLVRQLLEDKLGELADAGHPSASLTKCEYNAMSDRFVIELGPRQAAPKLLPMRGWR